MDQATRVSTSASKNRPKRAVAKAPTSAKSTIKELVAEHPAVEKARARISQIIRGNGAGPLDANMVGLALTLLSQQVGSFKAANALIDDFDLNKEYGIQKIDVD